MLDAAFSSAKWIIDTLIQRRNENKTIKREKWIQVADYLENIAKLIDESINFLKDDQIPYGNFSHLVEISRNFDVVLSQVYDSKKDDEIIRNYTSNLIDALHLLYLHDIATDSLANAISNGIDKNNTIISLHGFGSEIYPSLSITAGQFHGAASTLRALA